MNSLKWFLFPFECGSSKSNHRQKCPHIHCILLPLSTFMLYLIITWNVMLVISWGDLDSKQNFKMIAFIESTHPPHSLYLLVMPQPPQGMEHSLHSDHSLHKSSISVTRQIIIKLSDSKVARAQGLGEWLTVLTEPSSITFWAFTVETIDMIDACPTILTWLTSQSTRLRSCICNVPYSL